MSKFRVRAVWGGAVKPIELSRSGYSFNELRDEVRVKHEVREFQLKYSSPSAGEVTIQDDASLKKAVKDAEVRGNHNLEVRIVSNERPKTGGSAPAYSPSQHSQPRPAAPASSSPNIAPQQKPAPPSASAQLQTSANTIASFSVPADRNSTQEKLTVKANQEDDHFAFVPTPAKFPAEVAATLDGTKLTFESITNTPDGRSFKFTQAFNLPFTPNSSKTHVAGYILKLYFA